MTLSPASLGDLRPRTTLSAVIAQSIEPARASTLVRATLA